ncbi:MAG: ribonuclease HIII [Bacilli bacterium]|jgi:ribonuclease HIII|nr:ribonuclease HIII [Bacilli bacterium]
MKKAMPICALSVDAGKMGRMLRFYESAAKPVDNEYVALFATYEGGVVHLYKKNKKGDFKAVFQGVGALDEARIWDPNAVGETHQPTLKRELRPRGGAIRPFNLFPQIGSDEVGTGDVFGPVCVCAAYVAKGDLPRLKELGITDSKRMDDDYILSIGPALVKEFDYSQLSLPNGKYNEIHDELNMNAIKAILHNRCLLNLSKRHPNAHAYQDQFASPKLYYSYLKDEGEILRGITFKTQGETAFPSVALASVLARYSFLRKMAELSEKYGMRLPFGAGEEVDEAIAAFVKENGKEKLREVAKLNWANFKKLK